MIFDCIRMAIGDYNEAVIWPEGPTMSIIKQRLHNYLVVIQATGNVFGHNTVSQSIVSGGIVNNALVNPMRAINRTFSDVTKCY